MQEHCLVIVAPTTNSYHRLVPGYASTQYILLVQAIDLQ